MKSVGTTVVLLILLSLAVSANAFDYERKGFVIGVGAGYSPLMKGSRDEPAFTMDDETGLAANFVFGYAWNNQNMLLIHTNAASYEDTLNVYHEGELIHQNEISYVQGFTGLTYRHYFSPTGRSFFANAGFGFQMWVANERYSCHRGIGFLIGGGYEFVKHFEIGGNFSFGFTQSCGGYDYKHSQIIFAITGMLY